MTAKRRNGLRPQKKQTGPQAAVLPAERSLPPAGLGVMLTAVLSILLLGVALYANSFSGPFIWDDWHLIADNQYIQVPSVQNLQKIFSDTIMAGAGRDHGFYRPVQSLTYLTDYAAWKKNVFGYHLTNLALHIAVALAVFYLVWLLFQDAMVAFWTGLIFIAHPVQTEAVTYISGRADPLAALFLLLTLILYLQSSAAPAPGKAVLMVITFGLALLSRENSLALLPALLLYHYIFQKKLARPLFVPLAAAAVFYIVLRLTVLKALLPSPPGAAFFQRLPGVFVAFAGYIRLLFVPAPLHMEYGQPLFHWSDARVAAGVLLLAGLVFYFWKEKRRDPQAAFAAGWFLIFLLPHTNLFPLNAFMAEHWLYLPSVGFALLGATGLTRLYRGKGLKVAAVGLLCVWLGVNSWLTIRQNRVWIDPEKFYLHTLRYAPGSARLLNNLAMIYANQGRYQESIDLGLKSITTDPRQLSAYNTLAGVFNDLGRYQDVITVSRQAVAVDPSYVKIYNYLAIAYIRLGQYEAAAEACRTAIALKPDYAKPYDILAAAYQGLGRDSDALAVFQKALAVNPRYPEGWNNMGLLYLKLGRRDEAVAAFRKAIALRPDYKKASMNLGRALAQPGREGLRTEP